MSDEEKPGTEGGLAEQEIVVGVEDMVWEQPGLVDAQQQIHLAGRSLDILELHPAEEGSDLSQVDWGKICCDVTYVVGEDMLDLPVVVHRGTL